MATKTWCTSSYSTSELSDEEEVQMQNDLHDLGHMEQDDTAWLETTMKDTQNVIETNHMASSTSKSKSTNATEECMALVIKCVRGVPDLIPILGIT
ncbi:hypothetical protein F2Q69_00006256 [Brassica cretica]|uniref:Uncharacterized protein n=1 Tax=Brassica cretica TaxID=69181 RepID=A0A8S9NQM3_BRACR|nr:hypothetical protein F2Q69_00006256 [Brassica cretica]